MFCFVFKNLQIHTMKRALTRSATSRQKTTAPQRIFDKHGRAIVTRGKRMYSETKREFTTNGSYQTDGMFREQKQKKFFKRNLIYIKESI